MFYLTIYSAKYLSLLIKCTQLLKSLGTTHKYDNNIVSYKEQYVTNTE